MPDDDLLWDADPVVNCCVTALVVYAGGVVFVGVVVWLLLRLGGI